HPNIETIHEIDESGEHVFIVMGYVDGTNLLDKLRRTKMKITDVLDFAIQTAEGLAAAHEKGIVHRDIKSANVMVTSPHQAKIVAKLLEKDRARRYQEMSYVVRDLRAVHDEIAAAATAAKTKAIAVLPFANISPDRESDYFGDGLTEELIANLSRLKDVRVVS